MVIFFQYLLKSVQKQPIVSHVNHVRHIFSSSLFRLLAIGCLLFPSWETWAFLGSPNSLDRQPDRPGYLNVSAPPPLRTVEVLPQADRRNLLMLADALPGASLPLAVSVDEETPADFPLVQYGDDENASSIIDSPLMKDAISNSMDSLLPPSDPFVPTDFPEQNLNNTDDLIEILEAESDPSRSGFDPRVDFTPPYTMDSANMLLKSNSRYVRRVRK